MYGTTNGEFEQSVCWQSNKLEDSQCSDASNYSGVVHNISDVVRARVPRPRPGLSRPRPWPRPGLLRPRTRPRPGPSIWRDVSRTPKDPNIPINHRCINDEW
jgi:hypothetical protein